MYGLERTQMVLKEPNGPKRLSIIHLVPINSTRLRNPFNTNFVTNYEHIYKEMSSNYTGIHTYDVL